MTVLLLHGFPEFWYSWRHQIPALAGAGFRAVAPDLRGWGETDKPRGVAAYRISALLGDLKGLVEALGGAPVHVVGHDWGGGLAWLFAHQYPALTRSVTSLNAPHPKGFAQVMKAHPRQVALSWYMAFFQIPWLPETLLRLNVRHSMKSAFSKAVHKDAFSTADIDAYTENASRPFALTAGINYYRAAARYGVERELSGPITAQNLPAQVIWGAQDAFLVKANAESARPWFADCTVRYVPDSGHWVQFERPDLVNRDLLEFLKRG